MAEAALEEARQLVTNATRIVVLTGAGISAESGVPTFRGSEGLWQDYRPEELATPQAFRRNPRLVWEWYAWRRDLIGQCEPNDGHLAVARAQERWPHMRLVTQNVDGLHEEASRRVGAGVLHPWGRPLELHGSIFRVRCSECNWSEPDRRDLVESVRYRLPVCPRCESLARPDVVWFGEALDELILQAAFQAAQEADLCVIVGTSALVQPAASIPLVTLRAGGRLIEVNPDPTPLSEAAHVVLRSAAGASLPTLLA